jgi:hypothetical protein
LRRSTEIKAPIRSLKLQIREYKNMKNLFRTTAATIALMLPASLVSCSTTPDVTDVKAIILEIEKELAITPTLFVGKVANSNAYVAIENRGGKVEVYICDGTETTITIATWLDGTLINGTLAATSEDGASVTGTLTGNTISGTFKLANNSSLNFTAALSDQAPANLWQNLSDFGNPTTIGISERLGWIVLPDGTQKGGKSPTVAVVEQINPSTGSSDDVGGINSGTAPPTIVPTNEADFRENCQNIYSSDVANQEALDGDGLTGNAKKHYITRIKIMIRFARNEWKNQGCQAKFGNIGNPDFFA